MPPAPSAAVRVRAPEKFADPDRTADGARRATVPFRALRTLWFNTGTLCNLACATCYIESSPRNDRLVYLSLDEVREWLDDAAARGHAPEEIGFTGGEPFMNPDMVPMLRLCLERGLHALVLTNAMRPMMKASRGLLALPAARRERLLLRVSLDHHTAERHEAERGARSWAPAVAGLRWLVGATASRSPSPGGANGARRSPSRAPATGGCSPGSASPSTPPTRRRWCCSPRWTRRPTRPRSPSPAGEAVGAAPEEMMCAMLAHGQSNARARRGRRWRLAR